MRFNISVKTGEHSDIASSVAWSNENMLYSCSDDKTICKWTADGAPAGKINSIQSFTTAISWYPSSGKQVSIAITCILLFLELHTNACLGTNQSFSHLACSDH